jgi:hypothetical protein
MKWMRKSCVKGPEALSLIKDHNGSLDRSGKKGLFRALGKVAWVKVNAQVEHLTRTVILWTILVLERIVTTKQEASEKSRQ